MAGQHNPNMEDSLSSISFHNIPEFSTKAMPPLPKLKKTKHDLTFQHYLLSRKRSFSPEKGGIAHGETAGLFDQALEEDQAKLYSIAPEALPEILCGAALSDADAVDISDRTTPHLEFKKPQDVLDLECLLSTAFEGIPVIITQINTLPKTRKEVKEIHFTKMGDQWLHKVWVFKADPKATARELSIYAIAFNHGVPTGAPLGFNPAHYSKTYPFDIAILGGAVIDHAGDAYGSLLEKMYLSPEIMHSSALAITKILAETHIRLTSARDEFDRYGIPIAPVNIQKEIQERFLAGLKMNKGDGCALIHAAKQLFLFSEPSVISHGDLHTGNIVTKQGPSSKIHLYEFGFIDWGSTNLAHPFNDLQSFWIHHQRKAQQINPQYNYSFATMDEAYTDAFIRAGKSLGIVADLTDHRRNAFLHSAWWNFLEIFDPVRLDPPDIHEKAIRHCHALQFDLKSLCQVGYRTQAEDFRKELFKALAHQKYLHHLFQL